MSAVDLIELGLLPPLPMAFVRGEAQDLLEPLRFLAPGTDPEGNPPSVDRRELAAALGISNEACGHPKAGELAALLADLETLVVVTGQQPGMFGGPLYTLSKAVAAARWAERLSQEGRPAVAVFWVATEDHDFAEVAQAAVPGKDGLARWTLGEDPMPLTPVGLRPLGAPVEEVIAAWRAEYGSGHYGEWIDAVASAHQPDCRFGDAFCRTLVEMMGERCPLLLDAMHPAVKRAQRVGLARLVDERAVLEDEFIAADERIESQGFSLQVRPQRGLSPLFLTHEGARRRIEWREPGRFGLRGLEGFDESIDWLKELIQTDPGAVSPGVLARPAFQDLVLGTYLQILGPGEVAYIPQAAPTYRVLGVEPPWVSLRPQSLVLGSRQLRQAEEFDLTVAELARGDVDVAATVASRAGESFVAPVLEEIERQLASLEEPTMALDKSLERPLEKTSDQVRRAVGAFGHKVTAAAARRHEVMARRIDGLVNTVRPGDVLQERAISGAHFVGRFPSFVDSLWDQLDLDPRQLHLIDPERSRSE